MTTPFENFVNTALGKSLSADVTLPTTDDIPVFTGIGRQVTGKTTVELGLALSADLGTAASADVGDFDPAGSAATALSSANSYTDSAVTKVWKDHGNYNVSGGTAWPTSANTIGAVAIKAGNLWVVTGAATNGTTLTGGKVVSNGDTIRALVDNATDAGADWGVNEANLGYTPENQANKATSLSSPNNTEYPTTQAVATALADYEPELPAAVGATKFLREDRTFQDLPSVTFTEANFAVEQTGTPANKITWNLSALTAPRIHTIPNVALNFGYMVTGLSFVSSSGVLTVTAANTANNTTISLNAIADTAWRVYKSADTTARVNFSATNVGAGATVTLVAPVKTSNYSLQLGELSNVATTNSNTLSGTRNRIDGSSYTTLSGTDNIAIGCGDGTAPNAVTIAGVRITTINCSGFSLPRTGDNDNIFLNCYGFINPTGGGSNDLDYCAALNVRLGLSIGNPNVPDFSRQTLTGLGGSAFKSQICVIGSSTAAGNVDLALSGKKPIACTPYITSRMCTHYIKLIGSDNDGTDLNSLTRILTAEYKVTVRATGSGLALGTVQTIVAPFADLGSPDLSPTVTITITGSNYNSLLNINVGSSQATKWAAVVESYYTYI